MLVSRDQVTRALLTHEWTEMNPVEQGVAQVEKELGSGRGRADPQPLSVYNFSTHMSDLL